MISLLANAGAASGSSDAAASHICLSRNSTTREDEKVRETKLETRENVEGRERRVAGSGK